MEKHITILGVLYIVFSALSIIAAISIFIILAGAGIASQDEDAVAALIIIGTALAIFLAILALPGIIGGIGLLKWQSWARILVLILGFLNLLNIPFGTILGAYTIWALMNDKTIAEFNSRKRANQQTA